MPHNDYLAKLAREGKVGTKLGDRYRKALTQTLGENICDLLEELQASGQKLDFPEAADLGIDGVAEIISAAVEKAGGPVVLDWHGRKTT